MRNLLVVVVACAALFVLPAPAEAGDGKKLFSLLGEDVEAVMVIDVADARDSTTFDALIDSAPSKLAELLAHLDEVGVDARRDVDTIVVAGHAESFVVVLEGRFTKDQLAPFKTASTVHKHRGITYWANDRGELAMLGKRLVMASPGELEGVIDRHKKKGTSLVKSSKAAGVRAGIALVDQRHDFWIVMTGAKVGGAGSMGIEAVSFAGTFGDSLVLEIRGEVADPDQVALLTQGLDQAMPQVLQSLEQLGLKSMASSFALEWDGQVFDVGATVPADELRTLLGLLAMM